MDHLKSIIPPDTAHISYRSLFVQRWDKLSGWWSSAKLSDERLCCVRGAYYQLSTVIRVLDTHLLEPLTFS